MRRSNIGLTYSSQLARPLPMDPVRLMTCRCIVQVRDMMQKWSEKSWLYMSVNQGLFKAQINDCSTRILSYYLHGKHSVYNK